MRQRIAIDSYFGLRPISGYATAICEPKPSVGVVCAARRGGVAREWSSAVRVSALCAHVRGAVFFGRLRSRNGEQALCASASTRARCWRGEVRRWLAAAAFQAREQACSQGPALACESRGFVVKASHNQPVERTAFGSRSPAR
jgi:hypothetical protein